MQETLLRVFVVALGLMLCPRDDPGVEDWDEISATEMQKHEEALQRAEEELQHQTAPVREEIRPADSRERQGDTRGDPQEHDESGGDGASGTTVVGREGRADRTEARAKVDPGNYSRTDPNAEQRDVQTDGSRSFGSPSSENDAADTAEGEDDYLWYMWNLFSVISLIRFLRKFLGRSRGAGEDTEASPTRCAAAEVRLPDVDTLRLFHARCVQAASRRKWESDFLEGFMDEMLDAMRGICEKDGGMLIQDFQMVNRREVIVGVTLPEPFGLRCRFGTGDSSQLCGQIKVVESRKVQSDCPCQSSDGDGTVCLLHRDGEETKAADACDGPFCVPSTAFLSRSLVSRWFQSAVRRAWAIVSHQYQFELNVRRLDAPGAFAVRFRSGKTIRFNVSPAVKHAEAYFVAAPLSSDDSDAFWTLNLASYENRLLERLSERLPGNSCHLQVLEIALFLHKRQNALSGDVSALNDLHFKTALAHLLLTADPARWGPDNAAARLRDLLAFIQTGLEKRLLRHVLVGKPSAEVPELPAELAAAARPVNLFHPLVVHDCIHRNALMHFQEMLRNAHVLIHDHAAAAAAAAERVQA